MQAGHHNNRPPQTLEEKASYAKWLATASCYECGEVGRIKAKCQKKQSMSKEPETSQASAAYSEFEALAISFAYAACTQPRLSSAASQIGTLSRRNEWIIDSGSSDHMAWQLSDFTSFTPFPSPRDICLADNSSIKAHGHGTVNLKVVVEGKPKDVHLSSALYVPDLGNSLLSAKILTHRNFSVHFANEKCLIRSSRGEVVAESAGGGDLFNLHLQPRPTASIARSNAPTPSNLIHKQPIPFIKTGIPTTQQEISGTASPKGDTCTTADSPALTNTIPKDEGFSSKSFPDNPDARLTTLMVMPAHDSRHVTPTLASLDRTRIQGALGVRGRVEACACAPSAGTYRLSGNLNACRTYLL